MFLPDWSVNIVADVRCRCCCIVDKASAATCCFLPSSCTAPSFNIICGRQSCFYDTHCKWQALHCTVHCDFCNKSGQRERVGEWESDCLHQLQLPRSLCFALIALSNFLLVTLRSLLTALRSLLLALRSHLSVLRCSLHSALCLPLINVLRCRFCCCCFSVCILST